MLREDNGGRAGGIHALVTSAGGACDNDAALFEKALEHGGGVEGGLLDRELKLTRAGVRGKGALHDDLVAAGFAGQREVRFHAAGGGDDLIDDGEFGGGRIDGEQNGVTRSIAGGQFGGDGVVVHDDGGNRGAIFPDHIVDFPAAGIALAGEIAVVADDITGNFFQTFREKRVGKFGDDAIRGAVKFLLPVIGEFAIREIGVAPADEHQLAGEHALRVDGLSGLDRGVKAIRRAESGESQ